MEKNSLEWEHNDLTIHGQRKVKQDDFSIWPFYGDLGDTKCEFRKTGVHDYIIIIKQIEAFIRNWRTHYIFHWLDQPELENTERRIDLT